MIVAISASRIVFFRRRMMSATEPASQYSMTIFRFGFTKNLKDDEMGQAQCLKVKKERKMWQ